MENKRSALRKSLALDMGTADMKTQLKRRISFSGRHLVREFHGEEEPKTWNNSYEISDNLNVEETASNVYVSTEPKQVKSVVNISQDNKENLAKSNNSKKIELEHNELTKNQKPIPALKNISLLSTSNNLINVSYQNSKLYQIENTLDITLCDREMKFQIEMNKEDERGNANINSFSLDDNEKEVQSMGLGEKTIDFMTEVKNTCPTSKGNYNDNTDDGKRSKSTINKYPCSTVDNATEATIYMNDTLVMSCNENRLAINKNNDKIKTALQTISTQKSFSQSKDDKENINPMSILDFNKTVNNSFDMEIEDFNALHNKPNRNIEEASKDFQQKLNCISFLQESDDEMRLDRTTKLQNMTENIKYRPTINFNQSIEMSPKNNQEEKVCAENNINQWMLFSPKKVPKPDDVSIRNLESRQENVFSNHNRKSLLTENDESEEKLRQTIYLNQSIVEEFNNENKSNAKPKIKSRPTINFNQTIEISPPKINPDISKQNINYNEEMHASPKKLLEGFVDGKHLTVSENTTKCKQPKLVLRKIYTTPINMKRNTDNVSLSSTCYEKTQNEGNEPKVIKRQNADVEKTTPISENSLNFSIGSVKNMSLSQESSSFLIPSKFKAYNFKQLNDEIEQGKIQIFSNASKNPRSDQKLRTEFNQPPIKHRRTLVFEDVDIAICSDISIRKNKLKDYFDFDVTKNINANNTRRLNSQADDLTFDNTSYLAKAKLGDDETQSQNITRKEILQLNDSMEMFNESSSSGTELNRNNKENDSSVTETDCTLFQNTKPIFAQTVNIESLNKFTDIMKNNTTNEMEYSFNISEGECRQTLYLNEDVELCSDDNQNVMKEDGAMHNKISIPSIKEKTFYINDTEIDKYEKQSKENQLPKEQINKRQTIYPNTDIEEVSENIYNASHTEKNSKDNTTVKEKKDRLPRNYTNSNVKELNKDNYKSQQILCISEILNQDNFDDPQFRGQMTCSYNQEHKCNNNHRTYNSDLNAQYTRQDGPNCSEFTSQSKDFENDKTNYTIVCDKVEEITSRMEPVKDKTTFVCEQEMEIEDNNENFLQSLENKSSKDLQNDVEINLERDSTASMASKLKSVLKKQANSLVTPVKSGTSNHLLYLTPRLSLVEFMAIEKSLDEGKSHRKAEYFTQTYSDITNKRLSANLTPLQSISKKRQNFIDCSMEESLETVLVNQISKEETEYKKPLSLNERKENDVMEASATFSSKTFLSTPASQRQSRIPIPGSGEEILNECVSQINKSGNCLKACEEEYNIENDNFAESIQLIRKATTFSQIKNLPIEHSEDNVKKSSLFGDNPITISDVSVFFEAQRKSQIGVINMSGINSIENDKSGLENRFIHLTLEDIDKTRLSLVEASYEYECDEQNISISEEEPKKTESSSNTGINSQCKENDNYLQNERSVLCRKCKRCQDTIFNETTSSASNSYLLPELPPLPDLGLDRLHRLRKRPTISDVNVLWQNVDLINCTFMNDINISDDSYDITYIKDNSDDQCVSEIRIRRHKEDMQAFEKDIMVECVFVTPFKKLSFVERLNDLLRSNLNNWIFDSQKQYRGILSFTHRKMLTFALLLTFDEIDPFGCDIKLKYIKLEKGHIPEKYWKPIDFVLDFQLKLNLPFDLQSLCESSNETGVFKMLQTIDRICTDTIKMGILLQRISFANQAYIVRDGLRTHLRKTIRKIVNTNDDVLNQYVEKKVINIELLNLKTLSFKNICNPPLYNFCEKIQMLPVGLQFLKEFLPNPLLYLNT